MKKIFIYLFILSTGFRSSIGADTIVLERLNDLDERFGILSESTKASRNRIIKGIRKSEYAPPTTYSYTLKTGEDIWTIIARTSLNIDTIATLNKIDFIGMIREGKRVFLSDTLGLFIEYAENREAIAQRYSVNEKDIQIVNDPLSEGGQLLFIPERELSFLERSYLTGVVFHAPLMGAETSRFGLRQDPFINETTFHGGIDISSEEGKMVRASRWGEVVYADMSNGYGNLVIIQHELGYYTLYGHLKERTVEIDQMVETGQQIGTVGVTGRTTGPHLHFEIRRYSQRLNPDNIPSFLYHQ